ncbi:MAG: sugar nucleotide-binding protein [Collinsella sp.]
MARTCAEHGMTLGARLLRLRLDGTVGSHPEGEPLSARCPSTASPRPPATWPWPAARATTSSAAPWVIGDGRNFARTMRSPLRPRGRRVRRPREGVTVVDDQLGRLTFTDQMAEGILHLLGYRDGDVEPSAPAEYGTYNLTGSGPVESWAAIAARVFDLANGNGEAVEPVHHRRATTPPPRARSPRAPRTPTSTLSKIDSPGSAPRDWTEELAEYM